MDTYTLFKGPKRVTLKDEDMTTDKIGRIFQVCSSSVYITDDSNVAIFAGESGFFSSVDLVTRGHYEVHGDSAEVQSPDSNRPVAESGSVRFAFQRPSAAAGFASQAFLSAPRASMSKPFQRNVFLADLVGGKWTPQKTVAIRFHEHEASVPGILAKVQDAIGSEDGLILTDGQGNEIVDTEGTKGSSYWKQNSRKVFAVREQQFLEMRSKKIRVSQRDDDSQLPEVLERIEEVVLASQELPEVVQAIKGLSELTLAHRCFISFTDQERAAIKNAFACIICKGAMNDPVFAVCCQSLIACKVCFDQWQRNANTCVKCRGENSRENTYRVTGIGGALSALGDLIKD
ncbi:uncharacterized protein [Misgurnus anguillicaudatus]|uniref:uncharacterized protein n=1 Tax=Misgurnus anguillicaudatus TaxID=75329 RepID=UPI003CCFCD51